MTINAVQSSVNLARFGLGQTDSFVGSGVFQRIEYVRGSDGAIVKVEKKPPTTTATMQATRKYKAAASSSSSTAGGKKASTSTSTLPTLRRRLAAAAAATPSAPAPAKKLYW
jgi:hypothetical protein